MRLSGSVSRFVSAAFSGGAVGLARCRRSRIWERSPSRSQPMRSLLLCPTTRELYSRLRRSVWLIIFSTALARSFLAVSHCGLRLRRHGGAITPTIWSSFVANRSIRFHRKIRKSSFGRFHRYRRGFSVPPNTSRFSGSRRPNRIDVGHASVHACAKRFVTSGWAGSPMFRFSSGSGGGSFNALGFA